MSKRLHVTIMIGLPRSGKTTWVESNVIHEIVVSADDYFIDGATGGYVFRPEDIGKAHAWCFHKFLHHLQDGKDIVVDNTNFSNWERSPYVLAAQAFNAEVTFIRMRATAEECIARKDNGHGVPDATILAMEKRFEEVLPFWPGADAIVGV